jgi:hypothetical protein
VRTCLERTCRQTDARCERRVPFGLEQNILLNRSSTDERNILPNRSNSMRTLVLSPEHSVDQITLEHNGRGYVYIVQDRYENYILVSQRLNRIAAYLRHSGVDNVCACSMYDAVLRCKTGQLYKHRWLLHRLPLVEAVDYIRQARSEQLYHNQIILGTHHQYRVSRSTE